MSRAWTRSATRSASAGSARRTVAKRSGPRSVSGRSGGRATSFAPSFRMVIELEKDEVRTCLAGGPSDRRFSRWYCSDLANWTAGRYKTIRTEAKRPA